MTVNNQIFNAFFLPLFLTRDPNYTNTLLWTHQTYKKISRKHEMCNQPDFLGSHCQCPTRQQQKICISNIRAQAESKAQNQIH